MALTGKEIGARGYIDLTIACMRAFGAEVEVVSGYNERFLQRVSGLKKSNQTLPLML